MSNGISSASTIVSQWRGDSEKLVRVLFEWVRSRAPSWIFLDELDAMMSQCDGSGAMLDRRRRSSSARENICLLARCSEHEGSRRMKTELIVQLDGYAKSDDLVFLPAASNWPWWDSFEELSIPFLDCRELAHAMLRRLEKRVPVDWPTKEARQAMFQQCLPPTIIEENNGLVLCADLDYTRLGNGNVRSYLQWSRALFVFF